MRSLSGIKNPELPADRIIVHPDVRRMLAAEMELSAEMAVRLELVLDRSAASLKAMQTDHRLMSAKKRGRSGVGSTSSDGCPSPRSSRSAGSRLRRG